MVSKGRDSRPAGTSSPYSKLTDVSIAAIQHDRARGFTYAALALAYGVSKTTIHNLICGKTYR
jgi:hypothetical protein